LNPPTARPRHSAGHASGLGVALALLLPSLQAQGQALQWQADTVLSQSQWQEQSAQGVRLLDERGLLPGLRLQVGPAASAAQTWSLHLEAQAGTRDYNGQSSRGRPVQTDVGVQALSLGLAVQQPLTPSLALTGDLSPTWLRRHLHGVAGAAGYTEHWQWTLAMLGLQWQAAWGPGQLRVQAELGLPLVPQLHVQLPGLDPLTLRPQPGTAARLGVHWQGPLGTGDVGGGVWHAGLCAQSLPFRASPVVAGTLGGVLRAAVSQPATQTWGLQWQLGASWPWH
jgi:hypothetical protein